MHDTALQTGTLFLQQLAGPIGGTVAEIGSLNVNGGLREVAPPDLSYVGIDIVTGPGVDVVMNIGEPLPLDEASVDSIMTTSVLEHDEAFWDTFREMCRVTRPGGLVYISAPANGTVHRFPQDYWRFYPDAGLALERLSRRSAYPVTLLESFMPDRLASEWDDFVAVFRRDGAGPIPQARIHKLIACYNVRDIGAEGISTQRDRLPDAQIAWESALRHALGVEMFTKFREQTERTERELRSEIDRLNAALNRLTQEQTDTTMGAER